MTKYFEQDFEAGHVQAMVAEIWVLHYVAQALHGAYLVWHVSSLSLNIVQSLLLVAFGILQELPLAVLLLELFVFLLCADWIELVLEGELLVLSDEMVKDG